MIRVPFRKTKCAGGMKEENDRNVAFVQITKIYIICG